MLNDKKLHNNLLPSSYRCGYWGVSNKSVLASAFTTIDPSSIDAQELAKLGYTSGDLTKYKKSSTVKSVSGYSFEGCTTHIIKDSVICSCSHMTDFALIQALNFTSRTSVSGIRPKEDLFDLKLLRKWYQTFVVIFNSIYIPLVAAVAFIALKEMKRLQFREALMKEFYIYLSRFKGGEIKKLEKQKQEQILGRKIKVEEDDMETEADEISDEELKELIDEDKLAKAEIEEKIKKYSADISLMKSELRQKRSQTNKFQSEADVEVDFKDEDLKKYNENKILLKGKEELKMLRKRHAELEKQKKLKAKLQLIEKDQLKGAKSGAAANKLKVGAMPTVPMINIGTDNVKPGIPKTVSKPPTLPVDIKLPQDDPEKKPINKDEKSEDISKDEAADPSKPKELKLVIPKDAIKKKHPLIEANLVSYTDVMQIFHKQFITPELEALMKQNTDEAVKLIIEFADYHMTKFQNDKDMIFERMSFCKYFIWCNPILNFMLKFETFACPKWYRSLYWIWFALSHYFINGIAYRFFMPIPIEKDEAVLYSFFVGSKYGLQIFGVWSTTMVVVFIINAIVGTVYYPSENSFSLEEDPEYVEKILNNLKAVRKRGVIMISVLIGCAVVGCYIFGIWIELRQGRMIASTWIQGSFYAMLIDLLFIEFWSAFMVKTMAPVKIFNYIFSKLKKCKFPPIDMMMLCTNECALIREARQKYEEELKLNQKKKEVAPEPESKEEEKKNNEKAKKDKKDTTDKVKKSPAQKEGFKPVDDSAEISKDADQSNLLDQSLQGPARNSSRDNSPLRNSRSKIITKMNSIKMASARSKTGKVDTVEHKTDTIKLP